MMYCTEAFSASCPVTKYLLDILVRGEGIGDGAGRAVVRGDDVDSALVGGGGRGQVGLGQILGGVEVPVGGDLVDDLGLLVTRQRGLVLQRHGFAGVLDHERAIGDLGLDGFPGALEEQEGVVVGGGTGIQVQRVALGRTGLLDQELAPGSEPTATLSKVT